MKTAEQIEQECSLLSPQERVVKLSAWQLDAMREGMRRAHNVICGKKSKGMKLAILYAAEQLTEKDL
jgi:hypothetical protein